MKGGKVPGVDKNLNNLLKYERRELKDNGEGTI